MTLQITLTNEEQQRLTALHQQLRKELENTRFPQAQTLSTLKTGLLDVLLRYDGFPAIFEAARHQVTPLCLVSSDAATRNLPWHLPLLDEGRLFALEKAERPPTAHTPTNGLPLKILVMVAAPEGTTLLHHEQEELRLFNAVEPLLKEGKAQVHFTDDGSLESLERALQANHYHIVHFSGHGEFKDGVGYLLLEDEATGQPKRTPATEFKKALSRAAEVGKRPELVILSACQSAMGDATGDLQSTADTLLAGGAPAVVAMSASILDSCATEFTTALFAQLAQARPLAGAFREAIFVLKEFETVRLANYRHGAPPGQWLIPQLLVNQQIKQLADESKTFEKLDFRDAQLVTGKKQTLTLRGADRSQYNYVFVGRRKERRAALAYLRNPEQPFVLLRGQGGVGKTSLAEHLAVRMLAADPHYKVFVHSEKSPPLQTLVDRVRDFLTLEKKKAKVLLELQKIPEQLNQLIFLLDQVVENGHTPLFIFDNVESFQQEEEGHWVWNQEKHNDLFEGIRLIFSLGYPVIFTGRYPVAEWANLPQVDLNAVDFGDFKKKCWQLPFAETLAQRVAHDYTRDLAQKGSSDPAADFEAILQLLHRCFGGNYRALEFFDTLVAQQPERVLDTLSDLQRLEALARDTTLPHSPLARMSEDLVFDHLLALLDADEREALGLLARFRIPVLPMALGMQRAHRVWMDQLKRLADLTLVERSAGPRFFVMPLVQDLLLARGFLQPIFSEELAGDYHEAVEREGKSLNALTEYEQAFDFYCTTGVVEKVNVTGDRLCQFYYDVQQFRRVLAIGLRANEANGNLTDSRIWANLGLTFRMFGQLDEALHFQEKSLADDRLKGDARNEGTTLNNLAGIARAKGDYETALVYLQQSLKIQSEIKDRSGEGTTLNNIGQIYDSKGDYETALVYLQQSLKISQEIGDRKGEGTTLNNLASIAHAKRDYETALVYLLQSLKIRQEIRDWSGEGTTLNNISQIYHARGDYDLALVYLQQSLKISQEIGDRSGESVTLGNIAQIYRARGDAEAAMQYWARDIQICQDIGDINGLAITLTNVGSLFFEQVRFEEAVPLLFQAYQIFEKIGSPNVKAVGNYLGAIIEKIGETRFQEILQQLNQDE